MKMVQGNLLKKRKKSGLFKKRGHRKKFNYYKSYNTFIGPIWRGKFGESMEGKGKRGGERRGKKEIGIHKLSN